MYTDRDFDAEGLDAALEAEELTYQQAMFDHWQAEQAMAEYDAEARDRAEQLANATPPDEPCCEYCDAPGASECAACERQNAALGFTGPAAPPVLYCEICDEDSSATCVMARWHDMNVCTDCLETREELIAAGLWD